jgi:hypothetical protein
MLTDFHRQQMVDAMRPKDDVAAARGVVDVEPVLPRDK